MKKSLVILIIAIFLVKHSKHMTCKRLSYQRLVSDCLENIIRNQFLPTQAALVTIVFGQQLDTPIGEILNNIMIKIQTISQWFIYSTISQNLLPEDYNKYIRQEYRTEFYLIILDDNFDENQVLINIKDTQTFNPYALCLIYIETYSEHKEYRVRSILNKFLQSRFQSTAVLVYDNQNLLNLYTFNYTLIGGKVCEAHPMLNVMDQCIKGKMEHAKKTYFKKLDTRNFSNCTMNIVAQTYPPFVINKTDGFEIDILKIIEHDLNISFNIKIMPKSRWGQKVNGSWVGPLKFVYEKRELGIGNIGYGTISDNQLEFSYYYHVEPLIILVPAAPDIPRWRILTVIFTTEMWGVCVATIIFFGICFYLSRKFEKGASKNPFLTSFQVSITQPVNILPNTDLNRILFVALSILSIILSSAYTCTLIKDLKNPIKEHQISTHKELFDICLTMEYKYGGLSTYKEQLNHRRNKYNIIYQNYEIARGENDTVEYWIKEVAEKRALWTFSSKNYVRYLIAIDSNVATDEFGLPKIFVLNDQWSLYSLSMVARKGHIMIKPINKVLNKMLSSGLVDFSWRKYKTRILQGESSDTSVDVPTEPLSMEHMQGAFTLLIFGYGFGLLILACEIFIRKTHLNKKFYVVKTRLYRKIIKH